MDTDLLEMLAALSENRQLTFRGSFNWAVAPEAAKALAARDAMAMANSGGGWIVFGASEGSLSGLTRNEFDSFDRNSFKAFLKTCASPQVECAFFKLSLARETGEKLVVIAEIREFSTEPVRCLRDSYAADGRIRILEAGAIYHRTPEGKSERIVSRSGLRELVLAKAAQKNKQAAFIKHSARRSLAEAAEADDFFARNSAAGFGKSGYWELTCYPALYKETRAEIPVLSRIFEEANFSGGNFCFFKPRGCDMFARGLQHIYASPVSLECARIYKSGVFAWRSVIKEDFGVNPEAETIQTRRISCGNLTKEQRVLTLESAVELVARFFVFTGSFYGRLNLDCDLNVQVLLHRTGQRKLISESPFYNVPGGAIAQVESAAVFKTIKREDIAQASANAASAVENFLPLFNWHDAAAVRLAANRITAHVIANLSHPATHRLKKV